MARAINPLTAFRWRYAVPRFPRERPRYRSLTAMGPSSAEAVSAAIVRAVTKQKSVPGFQSLSDISK